MSNDERPTGLKANKGIELLTWGTPNGWKANIILEELKEAYGKDFTWQGINISQNIQKEEWFTKLGPNGRIPGKWYMYEMHVRHTLTSYLHLCSHRRPRPGRLRCPGGSW
jgi:hypothetical protein